jgi:hypothetical protein
MLGWKDLGIISWSTSTGGALLGQNWAMARPCFLLKTVYSYISKGHPIRSSGLPVALSVSVVLLSQFRSMDSATAMGDWHVPLYRLF